MEDEVSLGEAWDAVDSQSAYREGRGTEDCLLQVVNGLEEAQECATNILASTSDMVHAFDSLSRTASRMALYRLSVPVKVCEWLVGLDIDDETVVRPKGEEALGHPNAEIDQHLV